MKNNKGFTLVELLVVIVILGVITTMSWPVITRIQENNTVSKYEKYGDAMVSAAKLYVDSYEEDMFTYEDDMSDEQQAKGQCAYILYRDLAEKSLIKDYNSDGMTCNSESTFVKVTRKKGRYTYEYFLGCGDKKSDGSQLKNDGDDIYFTLPKQNTKNVPDPSKCNAITEEEPPEITSVEITSAQAGYNSAIVRVKVIATDNETESRFLKVCVSSSAANCAEADYKSYGTGAAFVTTYTIPGVSYDGSVKQVYVSIRDLGGNISRTSRDYTTYKSCTNRVETGQVEPITSCSVKCGGGSQKVNRLTKDPYTNVACTPNPATQACNTMDCCSKTSKKYTAWSGWGACSKPCGTGTQTRTRTYTFYSDYDGRTCSGATTETEQQNCNTMDCCSKVTRKYSNWTAWGACSKACGGGTQTRTRTYQDISDYDSRICKNTTTETQTQACNTTGCCTSTTTEYSSWSAWSACSKVCGTGTRSRTRTYTKKSTIDGSVCEAAKTETQTENCNTMDCCSSTSTQYGSWGGWSTCSKACGSGTQTRTRSYKQVSDYDGRDCGGAGTDSQSQACNATDCCSSTTNQYGSWSGWSACSKACGTGTQTRTRTYNKLSTITGQVCQANLTESQSQNCNTRGCCDSMSPSYGSWTDVTECSAACGGGSKRQQRTVTFKSDYDGSTCRTDTETRYVECNTTGCCDASVIEKRDYSGWTQVGSCSAACGEGTVTWRRRYNKYSTLNGQYCGQGTETEDRTCTGPSCCSSTRLVRRNCRITNYTQCYGAGSHYYGGTYRYSYDEVRISRYDDSTVCSTNTRTGSYPCERYPNCPYNG